MSLSKTSTPIPCPMDRDNFVHLNIICCSVRSWFWSEPIKKHSVISQEHETVLYSFQCGIYISGQKFICKIVWLIVLKVSGFWSEVSFKIGAVTRLLLLLLLLLFFLLIIFFSFLLLPSSERHDTCAVIRARSNFPYTEYDGQERPHKSGKSRLKHSRAEFQIDPAILAAIGHRFIAKKPRKLKMLTRRSEATRAETRNRGLYFFRPNTWDTTI